MRTTIFRFAILGLVITALASSAWAARFVVIAMPDTQNYSEYHPGIFTEHTNWIKANVSNLGIVFVTHLGDIVNDGPNTTQWTNARTAMQILNGVVPYGLAPGNHDLRSAPDVFECTKFLTYFGPSYFSGYSWYGDASPSGFSSYQIVSAGGYSLMFLHMTCGMPDSEISWAKSVLSSHSGMPTIVTTHEYMISSRRDRASTIPGRNSGEAQWNKLIRQYDQIFCVLCGHIFNPDGWHRQISINNAGRKVYEMLSDYQDIGNGYLRILTFDTVAGTLGVKTYSTHLDSYMTDSGNRFTYRFNLNERFTPDTTVRLLRPQVTSNFATGAESWRQVGDADSTLAWKSDAQGKGYLYLTDGASGTEDYFASPAKFRGDLSQYDAFTLDYRVFTDGADPDPIHIRLFSDSDYYDWYNTERVVNDGGWERLVASLKDSDLWTSSGTTEPFSSFITHVTGVRVFADIVGGAEQNGMDNFSLAKYEAMDRAVASSTFNSGRESWTTDADGDVSWDNHGSVEGTDQSTGGTWYFCAPSKFLGDKAICFRGKLEFDLKQSRADNQSDHDDVILSGAGQTLAMDFSTASNPDTSWTHYEVPLSLGVGWVNTSTGREPTANEFVAVLSSLTSLRIRGEYRTGADSAWLDNVVLSSADPVRIYNLGEIREQTDGTAVSIVNAVAATSSSSTFSDGSYYVEDLNRSTGVRIVPAVGLDPVVEGSRVTGTGLVRVDVNGERYIALKSISTGSGIPLRPLLLGNKAVSGRPDPTGLLVTVWGKVVYTEPTTPPERPGYVYIDDGSGVSLEPQQGIKVILTDLNTPITKDLNCHGILVTGILSLAPGESGTIPVIRPRGDSDILTFGTAPAP